ncbi:hypothetical protein L873DRAFT_1782718 [Choiromyces venosus 120613-1]|uniref:Uncharacterized protein n=1 Tax=Choiromyces venosus 120613-1 TaxID=1336337 RepID=A0A3N4J9I3_9PEZI|nr:hypothetical protein L873DRAFT_1782718 [Choiromyces venosus 120613-1]
MAALRQGQLDLEQRVVEVQQSLVKVTQSLVEVKQGLVEVKQSLVEVKQGLVEVKQSLVEVKQSMVEVKQSVAEVKQSQLDFQQGQADILEHLQRFEADSSRRDKNNIARLINHNATRGTTSLEPFYGLNGQLVPDFPRTGADIGRLNSDAINALLVALGLEVTGTVAVRKERFKRYIGLVTGAG